jgi:hypothetical protein
MREKTVHISSSAMDSLNVGTKKNQDDRDGLKRVGTFDGWGH